MKFLNKMERKFGRYAVRNLSAYIIAFYVAGYLMEVFTPDIFNYLTLEPYYILHGQVWRVVTWLLACRHLHWICLPLLCCFSIIQ